MRHSVFGRHSNESSVGPSMVSDSLRRRKSLSAIPQATAALASLWAMTSRDSPASGQPQELTGHKAGLSTTSQCNFCQSLSTKDTSFRFTVGQISASRSDCDACSALSTILEPYKLLPERTSEVKLYGENTLHLLFKDHTSGVENVKLVVYRSGDCPWALIKPLPCPRSFDTGSPVPQITRWLEKCNLKHGSCAISPKPQALPMRVLHITGSQEVRLLVTENNLRAHYACLSHCWGKVTPLQTTVSNIRTFEKEILWNQLPKTFQDAIDVTRGLGLEYLWIDSLCIVQDDPDDWRHEGGKMASIYTHAYVTLAATSSPNAHGGFYPSSSPASRVRSYTFLDESKNPFSLHVRRATDHTNFFCGDLPLLKRAWVFQERLLSPRVVHFTDQEIYWECNTGTVCEWSDLSLFGQYSSRLSTERGLAFKFSWFLLEAEDTNIHEGDLYLYTAFSWRNFVQSYSRLALTHDTDVFPALQGVVTRMMSVRKCAYFAGLWEDTIMIDLLWFYKPSVTRLCNDYRAPTWSWASQRGHVEWLHKRSADDYTRASIISITTQPVGDDNTGQLKSGRLVLRGMGVRLLDVSIPGSVPRDQSLGIRYRVQGETTRRRASFFRTLNLDLKVIPAGKNTVGDKKIDFPELLAVVVRRDTSKFGSCLMVAKIPQREGSGESLYRRVGVAKLYLIQLRDAGLGEEEVTVTII